MKKIILDNLESFLKQKTYENNLRLELIVKLANSSLELISPYGIIKHYEICRTQYGIYIVVSYYHGKEWLPLRQFIAQMIAVGLVQENELVKLRQVAKVWATAVKYKTGIFITVNNITRFIDYDLVRVSRLEFEDGVLFIVCEHQYLYGILLSELIINIM